MWFTVSYPTFELFHVHELTIYDIKGLFFPSDYILKSINSPVLFFEHQLFVYVIKVSLERRVSQIFS